MATVLDRESARERTNLVTAQGTFFGRIADLEEIHRLLGNAGSVVTLVGPGGIGKTTVARRYGKLHLAEHDGVWFCDLTDARSLGDVCASVGVALGVDGAEATESAWVERLGHVLERRGRALVIVDNCEQVIAATATALQRWRELAPEVRWLLTSREALHLAGERPCELGPLGLPAGGDDLEAAESVQLFVDRARVARPGYTLAAEDTAPVAELVRVLDGLPLAIELAAARMGVLSPSALLERLSRSFGALGHGPRDAPARQRTIQATVAWSWELLEPWEKAALRQCAVFRGGFTLEAAEAVVDLGAAGEAPPILDALQTLRDKSLLRTVRTASGAMRFGFYEPVRELAALELARSGEESETQARHARFFMKPAEAWERAPDAGPTYLALAGTAEDEFENLLAVRDRALARVGQDPAAGAEALRAAAALDPILRRWGSASQRLANFDQALFAAASATSQRAYRWLLREQAVLRQRPPDHPEFARVMSLAKSSGDTSLECWMLNSVGFLLIRHGELAKAKLELERALALSRERSLPQIEVGVLINLAVLHHDLGRPDEAERGFSEALERARTLTGAYRSVTVGLCLASLGDLLRMREEYEQAERHIEEAILEGAREPRERLLARGSLARLKHQQGDLGAARWMYLESTRGLREAGVPFYAIPLLASLGALLADRDETGLAVEAFAEAEMLAGPKQETALFESILLHRGHLDLAYARASERLGEAAKAAAHRAEARRRLDSKVASKTSDIHFARRMLERALAAAAAPAPKTTLELSRDAREVRTPDGRLLELGRRPRMRRLLLALVEARLRTPGRALSVTEIFETAWRGEQAMHESMHNRVYVAIGALRDVGLRDLLLHDLDGYLLDPSVEIAYRER